jgi:hypothetical protein
MTTEPEQEPRENSNPERQSSAAEIVPTTPDKANASATKESGLCGMICG